ncbi:MAG TPA: AMP-binding protein [Bryobacterales bacterium]|nr:AMP-binding protein [Bryobacterales bacterium]
MHSRVQTLAQLLLHTWAHSKPDQLLAGEGGARVAISSAELYRRVARLHFALRRLGLQRGDRCALLSEGRWERVAADFAMATGGIVGVLLDPALRGEQIRRALASSAARSIFVSTREQQEKIESIQKRSPLLDHVIAFEETTPDPARGLLGFTQLIAGGALDIKEREEFHAAIEKVQPEELASIVCASGAEDANGVLLTHADWLSGLLEAGLGIQPDDVALCCLPFSYLFARTIEYSCLLEGATVAHAATIEGALAGLEQVRPTLVAAEPAFFERLYLRVMQSLATLSPSRQKLFRWAFQVGARCRPCRLENRRLPADLRIEFAVADRLVFSALRAKLGGRIRRFMSSGGTLAPELTEFFHAVGLGSREETTITLGSRSSSDLRPTGST